MFLNSNDVESEMWDDESKIFWWIFFWCIIFQVCPSCVPALFYVLYGNMNRYGMFVWLTPPVIIDPVSLLVCTMYKYGFVFHLNKQSDLTRVVWKCHHYIFVEWAGAMIIIIKSRPFPEANLIIVLFTSLTVNAALYGAAFHSKLN